MTPTGLRSLGTCSGIRLLVKPVSSFSVCLASLQPSLQAILLACCYPDDWPLLVVVPAGLRGSWAAELGAWIPPAHQPQPGHIQVVRNGEDLRRILDAGEAVMEQTMWKW
jgi:hypothetical protein